MVRAHGHTVVPTVEHPEWERMVTGVTGTVHLADFMALRLEVDRLGDEVGELRETLRNVGPLLKVAGDALHKI